MKKFGLIIVTVVGSVLLLWAVAFNAHAAADSKAEIIEIEHQALDASTATELVSFYDPNDIITYDYIPGLQYVGAKAVYADVDHFFSNTKNLKGNFVDLQVETDGTMAVENLPHAYFFPGRSSHLEGSDESERIDPPGACDSTARRHCDE
jgi:hypothetical protein